MNIYEIINEKSCVYLSPYNNMTMLFKNYLFSNFNFKITGYIDSYKSNVEIYNLESIDKDKSKILILSPNYEKEILKRLIDFDTIVVKYYNSNYYYYKSYGLIPQLKYKYYSLENLFRSKIVNTQFFLSNYFNISLTHNISNFRKLNKVNNRVFIIGNGPSLKIKDLDKLYGEITIAANKIYLAFSETNWRPTYYTIEDPLDIKEYYNHIDKFDLGIKFFPYIDDVEIKRNNLYYQVIRGVESFSSVKCSSDPISGFYQGESVSFTMFQFALFLNATEIYLIGFDHNYTNPNGWENDLYKVSNSEKNHFHPEYRNKGDIWSEPRLDNITCQFKIIREYCEKNSIKIYNATRDGNLEVFERVDFDSLF